MSSFFTSWTNVKNFITSRNVSAQWVQLDQSYAIAAIDGNFSLECTIPIESPVVAGSDQDDFETNFKANGNQSPSGQVTTQFELNNKDLKLAKTLIVLNGASTGRSSLKVPGTAGSTDGRYIAGGYAISADYDADDWVGVFAEDTDRLIAWQIALASNPAATAPVSDATVQAMGTYPLYPIIKTFVDTELPDANQGWYFWPLATTGSGPACGECEVEPFGGYAFLPAGFYIVVSYNRLTKTTGSCRVNIEWGKKE